MDMDRGVTAGFPVMGDMIVSRVFIIASTMYCVLYTVSQKYGPLLLI